MPRAVHVEHQESFSPLERFAVLVTRKIGTPGMFLTIAGWSIAWLAWNLVGPTKDRFDPAPAFVLWLFISNCIQILLMPLVMIGQNLDARHADLRSEADYETDLETERRLEALQADVAEVLRRLAYAENHDGLSDLHPAPGSSGGTQ